MNSNYLFNKIFIYQKDPGKLLSCCKKFTVNRRYDVRWKNRIYFKDNKIKIVNCKDSHTRWTKCKEIWYKEGKVYQDDIDPENGCIFPAIISKCEKQLYKFFYKGGKIISIKMVGTFNYSF